MLLSSPPFPHDVSLLAVTPRLEDEASVDGMALRVEGREGESTIFEARNLQPAWLSRIWLAQPVRVPGGSRVVLRLDGRAGPAPQAWVDVLPSVSGRE